MLVEPILAALALVICWIGFICRRNAGHRKPTPKPYWKLRTRARQNQRSPPAQRAVHRRVVASVPRTTRNNCGPLSSSSAVLSVRLQSFQPSSLVHTRRTCRRWEAEWLPCIRKGWLRAAPILIGMAVLAGVLAACCACCARPALAAGWSLFSLLLLSGTATSLALLPSVQKRPAALATRMAQRAHKAVSDPFLYMKCESHLPHTRRRRSYWHRSVTLAARWDLLPCALEAWPLVFCAVNFWMFNKHRMLLWQGQVAHQTQAMLGRPSPSARLQEEPEGIAPASGTTLLPITGGGRVNKAEQKRVATLRRQSERQRLSAATPGASALPTHVASSTADASMPRATEAARGNALYRLLLSNPALIASSGVAASAVAVPGTTRFAAARPHLDDRAHHASLSGRSVLQHTLDTSHTCTACLAAHFLTHHTLARPALLPIS